MIIPVRPAAACALDVVAIGEVMLRLDPGEGRIRTTRGFRAWEGGGDSFEVEHLVRRGGARVQ